MAPPLIGPRSAPAPSRLDQPVEPSQPGPASVQAPSTAWSSTGSTVDAFSARGARGVAVPAPPPAPVELKSKALKGDATLAQVAAGTTTLAAGAKGPSVKHLQQALQSAGYPLPRFGADADFGGETKTALSRFQSDNHLPSTGTLDAATIAKLDTAAASSVRYPEYGKMMEGGVLDTTIGIGFDEDGNDLAQRKEVVQGLVDRGFTALDPAGKSAEDLKKLGLDPARVDRNATYYTKVFQNDGKDVRALVKLVDRNSPNAKQEFADGMANSSLVIYSGHARYGSGPDFDDIKSSKGNFVIGKPYEQGHVTIGKNDLAQTKLTDKYQMMFFDGCTTRHYIDDLRSIPKNKSAANLDIVASNKELPWDTGTGDVFSVLDGVMGHKSIDDVKSELEQRNKVGFTTDGFQNNTYRPQ